MEDRDLEETDLCAVCGEELDRSDVRLFFHSASTTVCYECARKHGGVFDSELERWTVAPQLKGLKHSLED